MKINVNYANLLRSPKTLTNQKKESRIYNNVNSKPTLDYLTYSNLSFMQRRKTAVYAIDLNGKYTRFDSIESCSQFLKINSAFLQSVEKNQTPVINGFCIVNAKQIELSDRKNETIYDSNGNPEVDTQKVAAIRGLIIKHPINTPVLTFNKEGEISIYSSRNLLANNLGVKPKDLESLSEIKIIDLDKVIIKKNGIPEINKTGDYILSYGRLSQYYAGHFSEQRKNPFIEKIGTVESDGTIRKVLFEPTASTQKIEHTQTQKPNDKKAIYIIKQDGTYRHFESIKQAVKETSEFTTAGISNALLKDSILEGKYIIATEDSICSLDENGEFVEDIEKIKKVILRFETTQHSPVYVIGLDGSYKRYETTTQASKDNNLTPIEIRNMLADPTKSRKGKACITAFNIEKRDESLRVVKDKKGEAILDKEMIKSLLQNLIDNSSPLLRVSRDGKITTYISSGHPASRTKNKESFLPNGANRGSYSSSKYFYLPLEDYVLRDKDGKIIFDENNHFVLDKEKINKIAKEVFTNKE